MKCTVLIENESLSEQLISEHGLSIYLETDHFKILFDSGQSDAFYRNAASLGIDLSLVDAFVLSHGHYDHGGGIVRFLECNDHAPVYVSHSAFGCFTHGFDKYIGLDQSLKLNNRLVYVDQIIELDTGITLIPVSELNLKYPVVSYGLYEKIDDCFVEDSFHHEIVLRIQDNQRTVLFTGCTHSGVLNMMHLFHPDVFIGGFHLKKVEDKKILLDLAEKLAQMNCQFYTGHCTGAIQTKIMKTVLKDRLMTFHTGTILKL